MIYTYMQTHVHVFNYIHGMKGEIINVYFNFFVPPAPGDENNVEGYEKKEFGKEGSEENERNDSRFTYDHQICLPRHVQLPTLY